MKNIIEAAQNLLPWLASLPLAHKIVISFILVLFLLFILLLIWFPFTRETKETLGTEKTEVALSNAQNQSRPSEDIKIGEPDKQPAQTSLTVKKIIDHIHSAPPFQRDGIAENYHGIAVNWEAKLWDINKSFSPTLFKKGEVIRVTLHPYERALYGIYFEVPVEEYPQFKIAQRGDLIGVSGRITDCSGPGMFVKLDVDEIIFHKKME